MFVKLISSTADPEITAAIAGRLCYSKDGYEGIKRSLNSLKAGEFVNDKVAMGHLSIIEHASFTFIAEGVSRAMTHQLVRHRLASYSQKSQRYVNEKKFDYITPATIKKNREAYEEYVKTMELIQKQYEKMVESGVPKEDARYILPNAAETKIIITMNARQLLHFFSLRLCNRAQWEIRELAALMLKEAKKSAPDIFTNCGPGCVTSKCPEGKMSCGKAAEMRKTYREKK